MDVDWVASTTSTNQILTDEFNEAQPFRLLGADVQSAGRGRRQRPWTSVAGDCLTFSIRLPSYRGAELPFLSSLPLIVGLAVVDAIMGWAQDNSLPLTGPLALKWPNDVLCGSEKIAGILIESTSAVVIGVGINVLFSEQLSEVLPIASGAAASLSPGGILDSSQKVTPDQLSALVAAVTLAVLSAQAIHRVSGFESYIQRWSDLHAFQGKVVCLRDDDKLVLQGTVEGVGSQGELLVRSTAGVSCRVLSGDLSLRKA
jgi:BirA family transcriptional regulator, biotin operon repressor / biotin---[acetyl-CoA-carboxylase] ligase